MPDIGKGGSDEVLGGLPPIPGLSFEQLFRLQQVENEVSSLELNRITPEQFEDLQEAVKSLTRQNMVLRNTCRALTKQAMAQGMLTWEPMTEAFGIDDAKPGTEGV